MKAKGNIKNLNQFVDEQYGKKGTSRRKKFEKEYQKFKLNVLMKPGKKKV